MTITAKQYTNVTRFLQKNYTEPLYQRDGIAHPALFFPAEANQQDNLDSIIGTIQPKFADPNSFGFYNYAYLHDLQNGKRHLFNGTTFVMTRIKRKPLTIDAQLGKYFDAIATCYALETELLAAGESTFIRLPMRKQYHLMTLADESIISGTGRSAAIGGATLIVFKNEGIYEVLLNVRKGSQATRPNAIHVLPAYMFQPMHNPMQPQDTSITHAFYREYLEELLGIAEGTDPISHPALTDLQQMQANGHAKLQLLGLVMNMLTLRPEVISLCVIHDATWWQRVHETYGVNLSESDSLITAPIANDEQLFDALPDQVYLQMPSQAYVALREGVDLARQLVKNYDN